jgi:hypothetical protein
VFEDGTPVTAGDLQVGKVYEIDLTKLKPVRLTERSSGKFDRTAYQREYMRKKRGSKKDAGSE